MKQAKLKIDREYRIGRVEREVFGSFIEHMGRAVYGGIYDPGHPTADERGFRGDVLGMVRELGVPVVRYPGGNFLSGYDWKDGVGPKPRKARLDFAWGQLEPNEVGILEFADWAEKADSSVMMSVNMGTGTPREAGELVEYCNHAGGSYWSDRRIADGRKQPLGVKYWCIGNEMDGDWQICAQTADEYGRKACETAKIMKWVDDDIRLVVCGSSGPNQPTYPAWDRTVLERTYDYVDYISLHRYYEYPERDRTRLQDFLASFVDFDAFIGTIAATADYVKAVKRSKKVMKLSIDEWNVWHTDPFDCTRPERWSVGPARVENRYDLADALVMAGMMCTLLNRADRVKMACLAQLVNVIAPILTERGGERVVRQTIYYPFCLGSRYARGESLKTALDCARTETVYGDAPLLCTAATYDEERGEIAVFAVNCDTREDCALEVSFSAFGRLKTLGHTELTAPDIALVNTFDCPDAVTPRERAVDAAPAEGFTYVLPRLSFHVFRYQVK